ncbi:MAG: transposase [Pseudomonadota bacterium]
MAYGGGLRASEVTDLKVGDIDRILIHVLPSGFHRIRHAGFLANGIRREGIKKIRGLLDAEPEPDQPPGEARTDDPVDPNAHQPCPKSGGAMIFVDTFLRGQTPTSCAPPRQDAA